MLPGHDAFVIGRSGAAIVRDHGARCVGVGAGC